MLPDARRSRNVRPPRLLSRRRRRWHHRPVRTAILSDIHSNLEALRACVAHARRQGVDGWAFAGDFVNYGADPLACLDLVRELGGETPLAVRGNHDACALGGLCETMHPVAREALYWTRGQLGAGERGFLAALPLTAHLEDALLVHASAHAPGDWEYVDGVPGARRCLAATGAPLVFAGHVHKTVLYHKAHVAIRARARRAKQHGRACASPASDPSHEGGSFQPEFVFDETVRAFAPPPGVAVPLVAGRRWLALPGSVGQPRDGNCAAAYLLFDQARREATFFRVPYDHHEAARKIVAAGLPDELARRLALGR